MKGENEIEQELDSKKIWTQRPETRRRRFRGAGGSEGAAHDATSISQSDGAAPIQIAAAAGAGAVGSELFGDYLDRVPEIAGIAEGRQLWIGGKRGPGRKGSSQCLCSDRELDLGLLRLALTEVHCLSY
ncbi:Hypothetical predicted protein [Marmota monax]|uniref:Uncharacterized protein n=1 Tax=Marmota monax TaxID=9995 RepID=A0A5E4AJI4_MARMO|nr:hypothetical protein GHT09_018522 [Marmota monax]VTJ56891.1 Hypothetical predicted protein [Marmota monax]